MRILKFLLLPILFLSYSMDLGPPGEKLTDEIVQSSQQLNVDTDHECEFNIINPVNPQFLVSNNDVVSIPLLEFTSGLTKDYYIILKSHLPVFYNLDDVAIYYDNKYILNKDFYFGLYYLNRQPPHGSTAFNMLC